jgi:hypothetical protein
LFADLAIPGLLRAEPTWRRGHRDDWYKLKKIVDFIEALAVARGWPKRVAAERVASWGLNRNALKAFILRDGKSVLEGGPSPAKKSKK